MILKLNIKLKINNSYFMKKKLKNIRYEKSDMLLFE